MSRKKPRSLIEIINQLEKEVSSFDLLISVQKGKRKVRKVYI